MYLDGMEELFNIPAGAEVVRTPDLIRIANVEIERRQVRRTTLILTEV
jgi:hypothetical protein